MSSLRQDVLQAELKRIEEEAEAKSYSIMNKADQLALAHVLCQTINRQDDHIQFFPSVVYHGVLGCEILIFTQEAGDHFLNRCKEENIEWAIEGKEFESFIQISVNGYPGVYVHLRSHFAHLALARAA